MKHLAALAGPLALAGFLAGFFAGPVAAQVEGFDEERSEAQAAFVTALEEHSEWCRGKKLFLARKRAMDFLLGQEPQHFESLKALGYKKGRDGQWKPPRKPKTFRDFNDRLVEEAEERFQQVLEPYRTRMHTLLKDRFLRHLAVRMLNQISTWFSQLPW